MRRKSKLIRKNYPKKNIFIFAGVMIIVLGAIILPGNILVVQEQKEYDQVNAVDAQYLASSSAMARNASSNLITEERLRLITGQWQSDVQEAKSYEMEQADYEAISLAREKLKELYDQGQYPTDLSSKYANWYNWKASPHKAVDTTFHTYTAYYWIIKFEKYDKTETHTIQMLEDGTIFLADVSVTDRIDRTILSNLSNAPQILGEVEGQTVVSLNNEKEYIEEWMPYNVDTSGLYMKSLALITQETKKQKEKNRFLLFQLAGDQRYLYALAPYGEKQ